MVDLIDGSTYVDFMNMSLTTATRNSSSSSVGFKWEKMAGMRVLKRRRTRGGGEAGMGSGGESCWRTEEEAILARCVGLVGVWELA